MACEKVSVCSDYRHPLHRSELLFHHGHEVTPVQEQDSVSASCLNSLFLCVMPLNINTNFHHQSWNSCFNRVLEVWRHTHPKKQPNIWAAKLCKLEKMKCPLHGPCPFKAQTFPKTNAERSLFQLLCDSDWHKELARKVLGQQSGEKIKVEYCLGSEDVKLSSNWTPDYWTSLALTSSNILLHTQASEAQAAAYQRQDCVYKASIWSV